MINENYKMFLPDTGNSSLLQELQIDIIPNNECNWPSHYLNDDHVCVMDQQQKLGGMCHVSQEGVILEIARLL